ncbi:hypothetical protein GGI43DRAFT_414199 [Trichoderma evansii]
MWNSYPASVGRSHLDTRTTDHVQSSMRSGVDSPASTYDEDQDTIDDLRSFQDRRPYMQSRGDPYRPREDANRPRYQPSQRGEQTLVQSKSAHHASSPFIHQTRESRDQQAIPKPVVEEHHPSINPYYPNTASAEPLPQQQPQQQSASYHGMGQFPGNTHPHSSNPQTDQLRHPTYYGYQNQMPGYGPGPYNYMHPGGTVTQYQPYYQQPYYQFSNLPYNYWPTHRPPSPPSTQPPANAPPPPPPDSEMLALKEELKAMKELTERAREAERRKQMEEQIRIEVEVEFQHQMELAKKAQEKAREEIEKIKTEAEIATREKILAERHAQAERERLETQQAIRFEREVRLKIERERVAEEAAKEARARQREEFEILMREKMLQSMEELTAMAKGKMILGIGAEKEDVETNRETVVDVMSVEKQDEEMFQNPGVNKYQTSNATVEEQEVCEQSSDRGDVLEQQTSTPRSGPQKQYNQYQFKFRGRDDTTEEQDYSPGEDMESRASLEHLSNASMGSGATHFSVPPAAPDIPDMSDEDDWKSSSSNGNSRSSYRPKRSRRAYNTYDGYSDEGQQFYPENHSYQHHRQYQEYSHYQEHHPYEEHGYYQERYPYQEYSRHQEYNPYQEHHNYRHYRPYQENYSYSVSQSYPGPMGELVEQVIDGVLSRLAGGPHWDLQTRQPSPHNGLSPRVRTVSSVSPSDTASAHSEAATLQSQLCESTRSHETSISDGQVSNTQLTIKGDALMMESYLPDRLETPKAPAPARIDIAVATTNSGKSAMQVNTESSIEDANNEQDNTFLEPRSESSESPALGRRPTPMCQLCGRLARLCKCSSVPHDTE